MSQRYRPYTPVASAEQATERTARLSMPKVSLLMAFGATLALASCSMVDDSATIEDEIGIKQSELLGDVEFDAACTADERVFLEEIMEYGRIAASTPAFEECVDEVVRNGSFGMGPYRECNGDPYYGSPVSTQVDKVLDVARSTFDVKMWCSGGGGNASTFLGDYGADDERFWWGGWLDAVHNQLDDPLCSANGNVQPCRFAPEPWPYSQASGISWHEVMHNHGYTHGANDQANAKINCGYPTSTNAEFHFQRNTMPYIVGACLDKVVNLSGEHCGNMETCGQNELRVIDGFDETSCSCVHDPRMDGIGALNVEADTFTSYEQVATDEWMGSWNLGDADKILGFGDFDGDGEDEYLIQSAWGLGVIGTYSSGRMYRQTAVQAEHWIGSWHYGTSNTVEGIGDISGDGRDDFVIRSSWGIGVIGLNASGNFTLHYARPFNSYVGSYYLRSGDTVAGVGDFNGDGDAEILMRGSTGTIGALYLYGSSMYSMNTWSPGTWVGSWNHGSLDTIEGVGDLDGDGKVEFVIRSGWGIGVIERASSGALSLIDANSFGTTLPVVSTIRPAWQLNAGDDIVAIADLNGDGSQDIVIKSSSALGVLSITSTGDLRSRTKYANGTSFYGGWRLGPTDQVVSVGNFDGYRGEDLLVRNGWGTGFITFKSNNFTFVSPALRAHGELMDSWLHSAVDVAHGSGDLDGDGIDEFIMQR